jgi:putative ABC transport system permease protein
MVIAFVFYGVIVTSVAAILRSETGVVIDPMKFNFVMLWAPAALIALGAIAGIVPAVKAYQTDVANNLTPHS